MIIVIISIFFSFSGDCGPLGDVSNGILSTQETTVDTIVHITCNSGYQLNGESTIHCLESQQWSASVPTCVKSMLYVCLFVFCLFVCFCLFVLIHVCVLLCVFVCLCLWIWLVCVCVCVHYQFSVHTIVCQLNDKSSQTVTPSKASYSLGEVVVFSCSSGYELQKGDKYLRCTESKREGRRGEERGGGGEGEERRGEEREREGVKKVEEKEKRREER